MGKSVTTASISRPYNAEAVRFGPFEFLPERSTLLKGGKRVRVGSRALAILKLLCEQHGQFVSNDDLIAAAWPETVVEETNLRVQITALRRLLGW